MLVTAIKTAGWHPDYGDIIAGQTYDVSGEVPGELFVPATPDQPEPDVESDQPTPKKGATP